MVVVVQLVERQIVILVVAGSSPVDHPIFLLRKPSLTRWAFLFYELKLMNVVFNFRLINQADSIEKINQILRSAYSSLAANGMKYAASHEDVEATRKNIGKGECHLVISNSEIIGCATIRRPGAELGPAWYANPGVITFGRFAINPIHQGQGIGSKFLDYIESRAKELGAKELALDTSEKADHLIKMYEKRNYRFIEYHQWDITNYRSVVMSKSL